VSVKNNEGAGRKQSQKAYRYSLLGLRGPSLIDIGNLKVSVLFTPFIFN